MSARPSGQQLDILPLILSVEEQANENALRVDNVMRNLVELASAVRTLVQKVEEQRRLIEDKLSDHSELYEMVPPVFSEDLPTTQFSILQAADSQIAQRVLQLEERLQSLPAADSAQPIDLSPVVSRVSRLETALASALTSIEKQSREGAGTADLAPVTRQIDRLREYIDSQSGGLSARLSALEKSASREGTGDSGQEVSFILDRIEAQEAELRDLQSKLDSSKVGAAELATLRRELEELRDAQIELPDDVVRTQQLSLAIMSLNKDLAALRESQPIAAGTVPVELESRLADLEQRVSSVSEAGSDLVSQPELDAALASLKADVEIVRAGQSTVQEQIAAQMEARLSATADSLEASLLRRIEDLENGQQVAGQGANSEDLEILESTLNERIATLHETIENSQRSQAEHAEAQIGELQQQLQAVESRLQAFVGEKLQQVNLTNEGLQQLEAEIAALRAEQVQLAQSAGSNEALQRIEAALVQLQSEHAQLRTQQAVFAEQKQLTRLMEHLSELQTRTARQADLLKDFEGQLQRGGQEQQLQLQNQLDMQERQRVLIEQLLGEVTGLKEQVGAQQSLVEQQQADVARLVGQAEQAARDRQLRRRASDAPLQDSTVQPLIESALHIERGEYAEAVRCLEAAQQISESPKLEQALQLARTLLQQQTASQPAETQAQA